MDKTCSKCKRVLPTSAFHRNSRAISGLQAYCRECQGAYDAAHYDRAKGTAKCRWVRFKKEYGLTKEAYLALLTAQDHRCRICGETITACSGPRPSFACVDHDHTTGEVRGALCYRCNVGLGGFRDRTDLLKKAIEYLDRT